MAQGQYTTWKLSIPTVVAKAVADRVHDPYTGRPSYGYRSRLVTAMLQTWLTDPSNQQKVQETLKQLDAKESAGDKINVDDNTKTD